MKTIRLREIVKAVTEDIHTGIPSMIKYRGKKYYRSESMINYCRCDKDELLKIDLLDLHYNIEVDVIDNEEEINKKKKEIEEIKGNIKDLESKIEDLENEIEDLEEDC